MKDPTKQSIEGLVAKVGLRKPDKFSQDWEYEVAESRLVSPLITAYLSRTDLTSEERFTLMIVILESFNDGLMDGSADLTDWNKIKEALIHDFSLHEATIEKWAMWEEKDPRNTFPITSKIRQLHKAIKKRTRRGLPGAKE